jgi:hypothetical protein
MLLGVIGAAVVGVAALAVLTPTVIVDDESPDVRLVAAAAPLQIAPPRLAPAPPAGPQGVPRFRRERPFRDPRGCLQKHGFGLGRPGRGALPDLRTMRRALKACRGTVPAVPFGP